MAKKFKITYKFPLFLVIATVGFVAIVSSLKISGTPKQTVYAKIKVSQGFWWASTTKPELWFAQGIKVDEVEKSLLGGEIAKVTSVSYYPYISQERGFEDKYDIYLTVKLAADYQGASKEVVFKRSPISIGSPIELSFPSSLVTGTIIDLSEKPFEENYLEKTVVLTKRFAYPWEYDAIQIGDTYNNGAETVFEVLDKSQIFTSVLSSDEYGNLTTQTREGTKYITILAKVKVLKKNDKLLFGEEHLLAPGNALPVATSNLVYDTYVISEIKD
jgi:hypothetical protein